MTPSKRLRSAVAVGCLAALAALIALSGRPAVDNSIHTMLDTGDEASRIFERFQRLFGTDELVAIQIRGDDLAAVLGHAQSAQSLLQQSPVVERVLAPGTSFPELTEALLDPVVRDLVEPDEITHTLAGPLSRALPLLTTSHPQALVLGFGRPASVADREALFDALEQLRGAARADAVTVRIAGPPLLNLTLDRAGRQIERTAMPLLLGVSVLLLLLTTRSLRITVALLIPVGLGVLSSDALLSLSGGTANVIVNVTKPLLFVLLLAAGVHVATRFADHRGRGLDPVQAAWAASADKRRATSLALLTTAIGFGSLALSDVSPIRTFGALSAVGLLLGIPLTLLGLPLLLGIIARGPAPSAGRGLERFAEQLVQFSLRRPRLSVLSGLALIAVGGLAVPHLRSEPHAIRYFASDHPMRADYEAMESSGLGLSTLEVVLTATSPWALDARAQAPVERFRAAASELEGVQAALALPLLLREVSHQVQRQDSLPDAELAATALAERPAALRLLLSEDGTSLRLALFIRTLDANQIDALERRLADLAKEHLPSRVELLVTGTYPVLLRAQRSLLRTLRDSLLTTLILMELVLLALLRSWRLAAVALLPNVVPVATNFAVMTALDIPVDLGTSMTAAVALGIALDDTLHVTVAWSHGGAVELAQRCGRALVLSSVVIGLGFLALTTSDFGPTRNFSLLAGLAMITALWGDLVMLPAMLARVTRT